MSFSDDNTESLDFLSGEVHALLLVCQALIRLHSHPEIHRAIRLVEQAGLAKIEGQPVSENTLLGFRFAMDALLTSLKET